MDEGSAPNTNAAISAHAACGGKVQIMPKCPIGDYSDLAIWYTPGVAAVSRAVAAHPDSVFELTNKGNTLAILSDGSRVLGLGNIGPEAALPVMEGKALLFKYFGGVDAVPLCVDASESDDIVAIAGALAPSFGGINLEDIATPKCFQVLDKLRTGLDLPIWHDDQQGTAVVALAGLLNALEIVGKRLENIQIALIGIGAANMAVYRMLRSEGVTPEQVVICDSRGVLNRGRADIDATLTPEKHAVAQESNRQQIQGGVTEALRGADVCIAFSRSGSDSIPPTAIASMKADPIVFACANPVPEILPEDAIAAGARIVATGRSDYRNQVNNSLAFPGVFRGALDVRASTITDGMTRAAAHALAELGQKGGLSERQILPKTDDPNVAATLAAVVGLTAQSEGVARLTRDHDSLYAGAMKRIMEARRATASLMRDGLIPSRDAFRRS